MRLTLLNSSDWRERLSRTYFYIYVYRIHVRSFGSTADTFITNSKGGEMLVASLAQVGFNLGNAMGA